MSPLQAIGIQTGLNPGLGSAYPSATSVLETMTVFSNKLYSSEFDTLLQHEVNKGLCHRFRKSEKFQTPQLVFFPCFVLSFMLVVPKAASSCLTHWFLFHETLTHLKNQFS